MKIKIKLLGLLIFLLILVTITSCSKQESVSSTSTLQSEFTTNIWRTTNKNSFTIYKFYSDSTFVSQSSTQTETGSYSYSNNNLTLTSLYSGINHINIYKNLQFVNDSIYMDENNLKHIPFLVKIK